MSEELLTEKHYVAEFVDAPAPTLAPRGPQVQRREKWVELPEEYKGFRFRLWVNAPSRLWAALRKQAEIPAGATDEEEKALEKEAEALRQQALSQIVLEHNGWIDFDGAPYPPASEPEAFWEAIPQELAVTVLVACQVEMAELPNSLRARKRR